MPGVVEAAKQNHNLDNIKGSRQYYTRMHRRMKRHNILSKNDMDWKKIQESMHIVFGNGGQQE